MSQPVADFGSKTAACLRRRDVAASQQACPSRWPILCMHTPSKTAAGMTLQHHSKEHKAHPSITTQRGGSTNIQASMGVCPLTMASIAHGARGLVLRMAPMALYCAWRPWPCIAHGARCLVLRMAPIAFCIAHGAHGLVLRMAPMALYCAWHPLPFVLQVPMALYCAWRPLPFVLQVPRRPCSCACPPPWASALCSCLTAWSCTLPRMAHGAAPWSIA